MNRDVLLTKLAMELSEWPRAPEPYESPEELDDKYLPWSWWESDDGGELVLRLYGEEINYQDWLVERARLINKPSWDDAPEYAEWLAQDADGEWFWYLSKPWTRSFSWEGRWHTGDNPDPGVIPAGHDWSETLEQRHAEPIPSEDTVNIPELLWDGVSWPPPEGTRVEVKLDNEADFSEAEVVLVGKSLSSQAPTIAAVETASGEIVFLASCHKGTNIRPIRTAEQRAVEALANVLEQYGIIPNPDNSVRTIVSRAIYDAIRDGKIPGIKLEAA